MLLHKIMPGELRDAARLKYHYDIERKLAQQLKNASKLERRQLYAEVYDTLFRSVPDHPQLTLIADPVAQTAKSDKRAKLLSRFLNKKSTFLEVGPGDCALALQVTKYAGKVYAVDVSAEITKGLKTPSNFELILSDGSSIPVAPNSVDVAYSDELMEHLHPDDALDQLKNLYKAIKPGGIYICVTPNPISGPHDISMYFTNKPTGFHLKEYKTTELAQILKKAGFRKVEVPVPFRGKYLVMPVFPALVAEAVLARLPRKASHWLANQIFVRWMFWRVLATK